MGRLGFIKIVGALKVAMASYLHSLSLSLSLTT